MAAKMGDYTGSTYISASRPDINAVSTDPHFRGPPSTSGLAAAISEFRLPVTSGSIRNSAAELLDLDNGGLALEPH